MDCSSEEQLIPMKLQNLDAVKSLVFDIPAPARLYRVVK